MTLIVVVAIWPDMADTHTALTTLVPLAHLTGSVVHRQVCSVVSVPVIYQTRTQAEYITCYLVSEMGDGWKEQPSWGSYDFDAELRPRRFASLCNTLELRVKKIYHHLQPTS